jgi:EAL domain-containing protein (putative c-di-GMP-specific phosphodiesterase class I)
MAPREVEGCLVVVVAVDPVPESDVLLPVLFVAASRLYGSHRIEDIAIGPRMTGIVMLNDTAVVHSCATLEQEIASLLRERGHTASRVEVSSIASTGSASIREAVEHWVTLLGAQTTISSQSHAFRQAITDLLSRRSLRTLFQPIVNLRTGAVIAYEALSRGPVGHPLESAEQLLEGARRAGLAREMNEGLAWLASLRARERFDHPEQLLFINLDADQFNPASSDIYDWQSPLLWPLERTVIELTERAPIQDLGLFVRLRDRARHLGLRFALDDAGAGYAGLATLAVLRPDFIKVDAALVRGCDSDHVKQSIISSLAYLADQTGAELMVEGIETVAELATVQELGVDLVQGFLLARPNETPALLRGVYRRRVTSPRALQHRRAAVGAR